MNSLTDPGPILTVSPEGIRFKTGDSICSMALPPVEQIMQRGYFDVNRREVVIFVTVFRAKSHKTAKMQTKLLLSCLFRSTAEV